MKAPDANGNHRILIIDDNPSIHDDIRKILAGTSVTRREVTEAASMLFEDEPAENLDEEWDIFEIDSAFQGQEGLKKVEAARQEGRPYSMAFVDVRMPPGWDGIETIGHLWKIQPDLQVIICTAYSDYSWPEMVKRIGKSESFLILRKPFDNLEVLQLAHALTEKWRLKNELTARLRNLDAMVEKRTFDLQASNERLKDEIEERMQLETALRLSEERFSKAFKASPIPLAIQSLRQEEYIDVNEGFAHLTGYSSEELIGHTSQQVNVWSDPAEYKSILGALRDGSAIRNRPCQMRTKSGKVRQVLLSVELFELARAPYLLMLAHDISEQVALEEQLRQAQKMEAVGQLAAGVAHDFNNILTVIQGHVSLALQTEQSHEDRESSLWAVSNAADRAGKLVRQLLAFSRKQAIQMRPITVEQTLSALKEMLPRLLTENIAIEIEQPSASSQIKADASMMDQMLMNLVLNARDAMPEGGRLTIRAETVVLDSFSEYTNPDSRAGEFVRLTVADTGTGIKAEVLPHIFEPFFTTKPVGKGTGLGLAAVYGIAKQHGGWVEVESESGAGAAFHIFIPTYLAKSEPAREPKPAAPINPLKGGHETILVVEDDEDVRELVGSVLESQGYKIITARSGREALDYSDTHPGHIDLLLTDMIMPGGVNGRELSEKLRAKDPKLKVLFTSGYSEELSGKHLLTANKGNFLGKPYETATLVHKVRACLDRVNVDARDSVGG